MMSTFTLEADYGVTIHRPDGDQLGYHAVSGDDLVLTLGEVGRARPAGLLPAVPPDGVVDPKAPRWFSFILHRAAAAR